MDEYLEVLKASVDRFLLHCSEVKLIIRLSFGAMGS